jgi:hypothetical protein
MASLVQSTVSALIGNGFTPFVFSFQQPVKLNNLLIAVINSFGSLTAVSDSLGSSWNLAYSIGSYRIYYAQAASSGGCTVTFGPTCGGIIRLAEFSGVLPILDGIPAGASDNSGNIISP